MKEEALKLALEALEDLGMKHYESTGEVLYKETFTAIKKALAQPEQEPVAMKFKIYKPTVPDPIRQGINNALLPWVYDQDRSSGFDATMWVTPVAHGGCSPDCKDGMTDSGGVHPWGEPVLIPCPNCAAIAKGEQQ